MTTSQDFTISKTRVITRRGVLWLGQTCNLRCHFCYFAQRVANKDHPDHPFMSIEKAKTICKGLRENYGNLAVDIQGGEPTIYPEILELVSYCKEIGLLPTLITNGLVLKDKDKCQALLDAGVRDLLISVHGIGEVYETTVGVPGSSKKQLQALRNCQEIGLPFRFNCVLAKSILPQIKDVTQLAIDSGARAVNFIAYNPFEDQQDSERGRQDMPLYTEVATPLREALDMLRKAGVEANVRYLPLCVLPEEYRMHFYNFQQLPYDLHEWDYASWSWTGRNPQRRRTENVEPFISLREANMHSPMFKNHDGYETDDSIPTEETYRHSAWIRAQEHCQYHYGEACQQCAAKGICDGFHGDYAKICGASEAQPISGSPIDSPLHYIKNQPKIVEHEDADWVKPE